ncbi:MAG: methyl-accepting chemotaxis protein [Spirochaetales bacterium]|nr:methyl-accepting chemotaxis protein [Spirochaetales bacterium]
MSSRKTIGFMTRPIGTPVGFAIWKGVLKAARKHNTNLITIDSGVVGQGGTLLYELFKKQNVDGVLTWASNQINEFTCYYEKQIQGIPLVTLTLPIDPYPVVKIDSYTSMKLAIAHLHEVHGIDKIAFIRGNLDNNYFSDRYKGYVDGLRERGIPMDERLVAGPIEFSKAIFDRENTRKALSLLIDERKLVPGKDFRAIISVTESTTLNVFEYFREKGIRVPEDVAVISYDNSSIGRFENPKPTAMILPFEGQSSYGFDLLMDRIAGKEVEREHSLPGALEINMSCGCKEKSLELAYSSRNYTLEKSRPPKKSPQEEFSYASVNRRIVETVLAELDEESKNSQVIMNTVGTHVGRILEAIGEEIGSDRRDRALPLLEELIRFFADNMVPFQALQNFLSQARELYIPHITELERLNKLENAFHLLRTKVSSMVSYYEGKKTADQERLSSNLNDFLRILASKYTFEEAFQVFEQWAHLVRIPELYAVLYDEPQSYTFLDPLPSGAQVVFGVKQGKRLVLNEGSRRFNPQEILPFSLKQGLDLSNMVIMPLVSNHQHIGYVCFLNGPEDRVLYAAVREQLANTLKSCLLLKTHQDDKSRSAEALAVLQQKAEVITENSDSINSLIQAINAAMNEISESINQISRDIARVSDESKTVVKVTDEANSFVEELNQQADEVNEITRLIGDITEKTKVLSINARIEAARAGASGKGFAVVANEISNLSHQTDASTQRISEMIGEMQNGSEKTSSSMSQIHSIIRMIDGLTENINEKLAAHLKATDSIVGQLSEASEGSSQIYKAISEAAGQG